MQPTVGRDWDYQLYPPTLADTLPYGYSIKFTCLMIWIGGVDELRTHNLLSANQVLQPVELQPHKKIINSFPSEPLCITITTFVLFAIQTSIG